MLQQQKKNKILPKNSNQKGSPEYDSKDLCDMFMDMVLSVTSEGVTCTISPRIEKERENTGIKGRPNYTFLASVPKQNVSLNTWNQSSLQLNLTLCTHQLHITTTRSQISKAYKKTCSIYNNTRKCQRRIWVIRNIAEHARDRHRINVSAGKL